MSVFINFSTPFMNKTASQVQQLVLANCQRFDGYLQPGLRTNQLTGSYLKKSAIF